MKAWALILLAACGQVELKPPTCHVAIDPSAERYREKFMMAFDAFVAADPASMTFDPPAPGEKLVLFKAISLDDPPPAGWTIFFHEATHGYDINLNEKVGSWWQHLPLSLIHELGHTCFRLCHSTDPANVMYKSSQKTEHTLESAVRDVLDGVPENPCEAPGE